VSLSADTDARFDFQTMGRRLSPAHGGSYHRWTGDPPAGHFIMTQPSDLDRWIADAAMPLHDNVVDVTIDAALDHALTRSNVVLLGELNHFVHEKAAYRLWWLSRLARKRRLVIGEELSWSDGGYVDRYLATGDDVVLAQAATFGGHHPERTDRNEQPTGVIAASFDAYPTALFFAEQRRFYAGLRALAPRRFFGFDIGAPSAIHAALEPHLTRLEAAAPHGTLARQIRAKLAPVPGESFGAEAMRLAQLRDELARADEVAGTELIRDLEAIIANLHYVALAYPATDYEALRPAMALREELMKRRVEHALGTLAADEVLVLMAHAFHLAKDDRRIGGAGVGPGGGQVPSLGHHLVHGLGLAPFAAWMLYGGGRDSQPFPDLPQTAVYPPTSLNAALARMGMPLVLPITEDAAAGALSADVGVGHMYGQVVSVHLPSEVDAIWFLPSVSPLQP
jgi:erythromycin esterase-like protein